MPDLFSAPIANNTIAKPVPFGVKPYQEPVQAPKQPLMQDGYPVPQQPTFAPTQPQAGMGMRPTTYSNYRDLYAGLANGLATQQTPGYDLLRGYSATKAGYLPDWAVRGGQMQQHGQPQPQTQQPPTTRNRNQFTDFGAGLGGGDDSYRCVVADSYLSNGLRAAQLPVGALYDCHHPVEGFHKSTLEAKGDLVSQPCVMLTTDGGAKLACSNTTPFNFVGVAADLEEGSYALAPDMQGHDVYVLRDGKQVTERVVSVEDLGEQLVVPLSFGGRSFPAGATPDALIYSHNIMKATDGGADIARMQGILDAYGFAQNDMSLSSGAGVLGGNPNAGGNMSAGQSWGSGAGPSNWYQAPTNSGQVDPSTGQQTAPQTGQYDYSTVPRSNTPINLVDPGAPAPQRPSFFGQIGNFARDHAGQIGRVGGGLFLGPLGAIGGQLIGNMIGGKKP